jgi:hypothetical protein
MSTLPLFHLDASSSNTFFNDGLKMYYYQRPRPRRRRPLTLSSTPATISLTPAILSSMQTTASSTPVPATLSSTPSTLSVTLLNLSSTLATLSSTPATVSLTPSTLSVTRLTLSSKVCVEFRACAVAIRASSCVSWFSFFNARSILGCPFSLFMRFTENISVIGDVSIQQGLTHSVKFHLFRHNRQNAEYLDHYFHDCIHQSLVQ